MFCYGGLVALIIICGGVARNVEEMNRYRTFDDALNYVLFNDIFCLLISVLLPRIALTQICCHHFFQHNTNRFIVKLVKNCKDNVRSSAAIFIRFTMNRY